MFQRKPGQLGGKGKSWSLVDDVVHIACGRAARECFFARDFPVVEESILSPDQGLPTPSQPPQTIARADFDLHAMMFRSFSTLRESWAHKIKK